MNTQLKPIFKWAVLIICYGFLAFKLITFNNYPALFKHLSHLSISHYAWIALVFGLLPLNILIEAHKWRQLLQGTENIKLTQATKAVLAGFSTGFFTPNRIGEPAGRVLFLQNENRKTGVVLSYLSGFIQSFVIAMLGLPAAFLFFSTIYSDFQFNKSLYFVLIALFLISTISVLFILPYISTLPIFKTKSVFVKGLSAQKSGNMLIVLILSSLRYVVFSIQFFAVLHFFDVTISIAEAAICIPASYLFVTFTPMFSFSEAAVRSSYALYFIGQLSPQTAGIAFAGFAIWFINSGIPMIIGGRLILKLKN